MIEQMKLRQTFVTSEIQDGDVICFQAEISDKESVSREMPCYLTYC